MIGRRFMGSSWRVFFRGARTWAYWSKPGLVLRLARHAFRSWCRGDGGHLLYDGTTFILVPECGDIPEALQGLAKTPAGLPMGSYFQGRWFAGYLNHACTGNILQYPMESRKRLEGWLVWQLPEARANIPPRPRVA